MTISEIAPADKGQPSPSISLPNLSSPVQPVLLPTAYLMNPLHITPIALDIAVPVHASAAFCGAFGARMHQIVSSADSSFLLLLVSLTFKKMLVKQGRSTTPNHCQCLSESGHSGPVLLFLWARARDICRHELAFRVLLTPQRCHV